MSKLRWPSWAPVTNKPTVSVDVKQHSANQPTNQVWIQVHTHICFSSKCDNRLLDAVVALATPRQQSAGTSVVMDKLHALELQLQATRTELQTTKAELQTTKAELQTTRTDLKGSLTAVNGSVTNRGQYFL